MNKLLIPVRLIWNIFAERFFSMKVGTIAVLLFFIHHILLSPLKQYCANVGYDTSPWVFPFLISNIYLQILIFAVVLYYFSSVPFMQQFGMYQMVRMGRQKWALCQIGSIMLSGLGLVVMMILESVAVLFPYIQCEGNWGKVLHTIALTNAGEEFGLTIGINYEFMAKYNAVSGMAISILLCMMMVVFLGLLMFTVSLYLSRVWAMGIASVFMALPIILQNIPVNRQLFFSKLFPTSWLQVTRIGGLKYGYQILPQMMWVLIALAVLIGLLCTIIILRVRTVEFQWSHEE